MEQMENPFTSDLLLGQSVLTTAVQCSQRCSLKTCYPKDTRSNCLLTVVQFKHPNLEACSSSSALLENTENQAA